MNDLSIIGADTLPNLIDRAAHALSSARSSAEVLEARDMARVAYDAAKSAGRMARAKAAHDEVIAAVYRAQADAAVIEARAKVRLADEYDEAQRRGEVAGHGGADRGNQFANVEQRNVATAADLGLRRDEIHDARQLRDAEAADPGRIEAAAAALVARGEEPTKAALRREVIDKPEQRKPRHGLSALTREALEDDIIGLREALAKAKATIEAQKEEIADLKSRLAEALSGDLGRALGNAQRRASAAEGRMREYQAIAVRADRKSKIVEAECEKLRKELFNQIIPMS